MWLLPEVKVGKAPHEVDEFRLRKSGVSSEQSQQTEVSMPEDWNDKTELELRLTELGLHIKNDEL